jgi:hypothetical protein
MTSATPTNEEEPATPSSPDLPHRLLTIAEAPST